jgi:serine/threonine-protein kinase
MSLDVGQVVGGCRIEEPIARGGMGEVYRATQLSLDRPVALKVIAPELGIDPAFTERFRREARAAAAIDHPNILPVHETGETDSGLVYIVMRLVRGQDLGALLAERGRLDPHEALTILTPVAQALDAAHAAGLVHRDIKPANVLLEPREDGGITPLLTDFGLAKRTGGFSRHTQTGNVVGTADYMAPEQAQGDDSLDGRVDVYAFGCMLYACLTGDVPYRRSAAMATLMAHVNEPVPVPSAAVPGLPPALDRVVGRAMAKDRAARAASAGALMRWATEQLGPPPRAADGASSPTAVMDISPAAPAPSGRPGALAGAAALLGVCWTVAYLVGASL